MKFRFLLYEYLLARAEIIGADFTLSLPEIEKLFTLGFRNFSGVQVNEVFFPCWDDDEPITHRGLLNSFICFYISKEYPTILDTLKFSH
jgi:hypothetical protein